MANHDADDRRVAELLMENDGLHEQVAFLEEEVATLRQRLLEAPRQIEVAETRLTETRETLTLVTDQNERLVATLREARDQIIALKEELDRVTGPPLGFGIFLADRGDGSAEVFTGGRKLRVSYETDIDPGKLRSGQEVMLNEALNIVEARWVPSTGELYTFTRALPHEDRIIALNHSGEKEVLKLTHQLKDIHMTEGDLLLVDGRAGVVLERIPVDIEGLSERKIPGVTWDSIGGLEGQVQTLRALAEIPLRYANRLCEMGVHGQNGILLSGPIGCGKTLLVNALANAVAANAEMDGEDPPIFLDISTPHLLDKYVGETEKAVRVPFERARAEASAGRRVIMLFTEFDALFNLRGRGDSPGSAVSEFAADMDGIAPFRHILVIGETNREDLVDPSLLRHGRLGQHVRIPRPDAKAAREILVRQLRLMDPDSAPDLANSIVEQLYAPAEQNAIAEVCYGDSSNQVLYVRDFLTGSALRAVALRAAELAALRNITGGLKEITLTDIIQAIHYEVSDPEQLLLMTQKRDWPVRDEQIQSVRTLSRPGYAGRVVSWENT
ncbi:AAA family ATPase [Nonomuraea sp. NPDC004580]|uniref:AAA family ATPase n=1 Tax=Nonomuraea sp. NPDC004580 TaxID=3154552 RepID=UPI0033AD5612